MASAPKVSGPLELRWPCTDLLSGTMAEIVAATSAATASAPAADLAPRSSWSHRTRSAAACWSAKPRSNPRWGQQAGRTAAPRWHPLCFDGQEILRSAAPPRSAPLSFDGQEFIRAAAQLDRSLVRASRLSRSLGRYQIRCGPDELLSVGCVMPLGAADRTISCLSKQRGALATNSPVASCSLRGELLAYSASGRVTRMSRWVTAR
jgi:hypothetical protein